MNVDCLVCHDKSGIYKKFPKDCGHPAYQDKKFKGEPYKAVDLSLVARSVGKPDRRNCGTCHFFGGGGVMVKHGDLDVSMISPSKSIDVHMATDGLNFRCTRCHTTKKHQIAGRHYSMPAPIKHKYLPPGKAENTLSCESCHGSTPHKNSEKINHHTDKVACQTCHIPFFARENSTKIWWDWSTAGLLNENGKPMQKKDPEGNVIYDTRKGSFKWEKNVVPEYKWYNGLFTYVKLSDKIDDSEVVDLNKPHGSYEDSGSRIYPFKIHLGRQVYDTENKTMVVPKLFGKKGSGAYWKEYDWIKSAEAGMKASNAPFSGKIGFVKTAHTGLLLIW